MPVLQLGCQVWGLHSPFFVAARSALHRLYNDYLGTVCGLPPSTPRKPFLTGLGLVPLQVFGGAKLCSVGIVWLLFPLVPSTTIVWLDNLTNVMPFQGVACNMASLLAAC